MSESSAKPAQIHNNRDGADRSEKPHWESFLQETIHDARNGNAAARENLLTEVSALHKDGMLTWVVNELSKPDSAGARLVRNAKGEPDHIIFGKNGPYVDLESGTLNGMSAEQLAQESIRQAGDFGAAIVADPHHRDSNGKQFSKEVQATANELNQSLLKGDLKALTEAAQQLMRAPDASKLKTVQDALNQQGSGQFKFDSNNGIPFLQVGNAHAALVIPNGGQAIAMSVDRSGNLIEGSTEDLSRTLQIAGEHGIESIEMNIHSYGEFLEKRGRLPEEGVTNMPRLIRNFEKAVDEQIYEYIKMMAKQRRQH